MAPDPENGDGIPGRSAPGHHQQKYGKLVLALTSFLSRKSRKIQSQDVVAPTGLVAQLYGDAQLSDSDRDLLHRHFTSMPSSYAATGFSVQQVKEHIALLERATQLKEGVVAMRFELREEDECSVRDASTCDSSCSSSAGGFSAFSSDGASAVCRVDVSFARSTHICRPALASSFRQAGMSVISLSMWDTAQAGGTLGLASLRVCKEEFSQQQLEQVFSSLDSAGSKSQRMVATGTGALAARTARIADPLSFFASHSTSNSARQSPCHPCFSERNSRCASKKSSPLHLHRRAPTVAGSEGEVDAAAGLLEFLLSEKGSMKKELGKFVLDPLKLEMGPVIALGSSGEVRRGTYDGEQVAVKVLKAKDSQAVVAEFRREVLTLMACGESPHLLKFYGICVDVRSRMCIVTRFMEGGTLHEFLQKRNGAKLPLTQVLSLAHDIAAGMAFLHSNGMLHRDLKSANVLLDGDGHAVVGDFGVARLKGERGEMTKEVGTYRWMAPEAFGTSAWPVTNKSDVYSYGIVLWELISMSLPFESYSPLQAAVAVTLTGLRPLMPQDCPDGLKSLIERCWAKDPKDRPNFEEVLEELDMLSALLLPKEA